VYLKSLVAPQVRLSWLAIAHGADLVWQDVKNIKVTMCPPTWFHQRHGSDGTYDLTVYKNDGQFYPRLLDYMAHPRAADEYFEDLAKAYREEIEELYGLGCRTCISPHIQERVTS
jgi:hypothetical protein